MSVSSVHVDKVTCDICNKTSALVETQTQILDETIKLIDRGWSFRNCNSLDGAVCPSCLDIAQKVSEMLGWVIE